MNNKMLALAIAIVAGLGVASVAVVAAYNTAYPYGYGSGSSSSSYGPNYAPTTYNSGYYGEQTAPGQSPSPQQYYNQQNYNQQPTAPQNNNNYNNNSGLYGAAKPSLYGNQAQPNLSSRSAGNLSSSAHLGSSQNANQYGNKPSVKISVVEAYWVSYQGNFSQDFGTTPAYNSNTVTKFKGLLTAGDPRVNQNQFVVGQMQRYLDANQQVNSDGTVSIAPFTIGVNMFGNNLPGPVGTFYGGYVFYVHLSLQPIDAQGNAIGQAKDWIALFYMGNVFNETFSANN